MMAPGRLFCSGSITIRYLRRIIAFRNCGDYVLGVIISSFSSWQRLDLGWWELSIFGSEMNIKRGRAYDIWRLGTCTMSSSLKIPKDTRIHCISRVPLALHRKINISTPKIYALWTQRRQASRCQCRILITCWSVELSCCWRVQA